MGEPDPEHKFLGVLEYWSIGTPNNSILGNSPTAKELRQQRGYIGHIRPKTIKGHKYYDWI
jgi:hypothetical protein